MKILAAASLLLLALPAVFLLPAVPAEAAPPHDVLGFTPGQPAAEGLALVKKYAAKPCDTPKCFVFNTTYLGRRTRVFVELDDKTGVTRVGFTVSNDSQPEVPDCAKMGGEIVAGAAKAYGKFDESDPGATYTWRDAKLKYKLTVICIASVQHPPVGSIVGMFEKVSAAR